MILREGPFVGDEVEGRLKGVWTLFLDGGPLSTYSRMIKEEQCAHIFIRHRLLMQLTKEDWLTIERWIDQHHYIVSLECGPADLPMIPAGLLAKVHILCVWDFPFLGILKDTDTLKIRGNIAGQSITVTVGTCFRHRIEDYVGDAAVEELIYDDGEPA